MNPTWSPDSKSIAFVSTRPLDTPLERISVTLRRLGYGNIFIAEPDGRNLRAVSQPVGATKDRPVWSPDSRAVAFLAMEHYTGSDLGFRRVLYVVNADGTGLTRISETESQPTWSPDGTKLAFAISRDQSLDVYTTNSDGSNRRRITNHQHGGFSNISSLSWSRDDSMIRFVATRTDSRKSEVNRPISGIFAVDVDGSDTSVIAKLDHHYPITWSPDDTRVVILAIPEDSQSDRSVDTNTLVCSLAADGSDVRVLVRRGLGGLVAEHSGWKEIEDDIEACGSGSVVPEPEKNLGLVEDCRTLVRARNGLGGPDLPILWNANIRIFDWAGVTVGGEPPRVKTVSFSGELDGGVIPPIVGNLTELEHIHFKDGALSGPIPRELGSLRQLKSLNLSWNYLTGNIPPQLGQLVNVKLLFLHRNALSGNIRAELGKMTALESFRAGDNQLTGNIPREMGRMTSLKSLGMAGNELTGCIPSEILELPSLKVFNHDGLPQCDP